MPQYSKTTWVDGTAPAIDATNLNKIEQGIFDAFRQDGSTTMSAQLVTTAGSDTTPAIAPTGDSNTGIFFPAADTISFGTSGGEVIRINSGRNVGVGITDQSYKLDVAAYTATPFRAQRSGEYGEVIKIGRYGVSDGAGIGYPADNTLTLTTGGSERMRITSAGNVGIGTTSPSSILHVSSATASYAPSIRITNTGTSIDQQSVLAFYTDNTTTNQFLIGKNNVAGGSSVFLSNQANSSMFFETNAQTRMTITGAGNVGIGTNSPTNKLQIANVTANTSCINAVANTTTGQSFGIALSAGTNATDYALNVRNAAQTIQLFHITGAGNVGIGTTSPSAVLHVTGSTANDMAIFESSDAGATAAPDVVLYRNSASPAANDILGSLVFRGKDSGANTFNYAEIAGIITDPTDTVETGQLRFYTATSGASSEKMRITTSGTVGINTLTNPAVALDVTGSNTTIGTLNYTMRLTSTGTYDTFPMAGIAFAYKHDGVGHVTTGAGIAGGKENDVDSNLGSVLRFFTRTSAAAVAERMRVTSAGYLLIGYTTSNGAYPLQVNGQIFATSATIATSDGKYKKDVVALDGALDIVTKLNPVQFSWKEHPVHKFNTDVPTVGFIAQEVAEVLKDKAYLTSLIKKSECTWETETGETVDREVTRDVETQVEREITEEIDGEEVTRTVTETVIEQVTEIITEPVKETHTEEFLGIAESNMIAILTKAIQELNAKVEALQAQLAK